MAKLAKHKPGPPVAPVVATLFVQQRAANSDYSEFTRYAGLLPDIAAVFPEPVLFVGKPQGEFIGQCALMLLSQQVGNARRFHSGLRYVGTGAGELRCYVGDCKRNYRDASETGKTLIAVFEAPRPGCLGCMLLFVTARPYARKRPKANTAYGQRFFREYVRPRLSGWLQSIPVEAQLF
jgi:hypothetical protein